MGHIQVQNWCNSQKKADKSKSTIDILWLLNRAHARLLEGALQKNYCPLEVEALAIVFTCSKFNEYLFGKKRRQ